MSPVSARAARGRNSFFIARSQLVGSRIGSDSALCRLAGELDGMARIATRELVLDDVAVAIIEAAVDGDTEALDILPAQTLVHGEDAAALQEVL